MTELTPTELKNLCDYGLSVPDAEDLIINNSLMLSASLNGQPFLAGSAYVIGSYDWQRKDETITTVFAVTAKHCLSNLHDNYNFPLPRERWPGEFEEPPVVRPPWSLVAIGGRPEAPGLWNCIFSTSYVDDLGLVILRPGNEIAKNTKFEQPLICFGFPNISDEMWGFGFAESRSLTPSPPYIFETKPQLTRGKVVQRYEGTSREERLLVSIPTFDAMSGGPVFWARMLTAVISSTMQSPEGIGQASFVTRIRHVVNIPLTEAPEFADQKFNTVMDLAQAGIINILGPDVAPQDELTLVERHNLTAYFRM